MAQIESKSELKKLFILYARMYIHKPFICSVSSKKKRKEKKLGSSKCFISKIFLCNISQFLFACPISCPFSLCETSFFFLSFPALEILFICEMVLTVRGKQDKTHFLKTKKKTEFLGRFSFFSVAILKIEFLAYFFGTVAFFLFLRVGFF